MQGYMRFSLKTRMNKDGVWEADFVVTKDGAFSNSQENVITLFLNNVWGWQGAEACYTEGGTGPRGLFGYRTLFTREKLGVESVVRPLTTWPSKLLMLWQHIILNLNFRYCTRQRTFHTQRDYSVSMDQRLMVGVMLYKLHQYRGCVTGYKTLIFSYAVSR